MPHTINHILALHPDTTEGQWKQHDNGGGWVHCSAKVNARAAIYDGVIRGGVIYDGVIRGGEIYDGVIRGGEIWGGVIWGGVIYDGVIRGGVIRGGVIRGGVIWGGVIYDGVIRGGVIRGGEIWGGVIRGGVIYDGVIRGGEIWGGVIWGGEIYDGVIRGGEIWGGAWKTSPLFIQGTRFSLNNSAPGQLCVGCQNYPFEWWIEHGEALGRHEGFSPEEIIEYRGHIRYIIEHGRPAELPLEIPVEEKKAEEVAA